MSESVYLIDLLILLAAAVLAVALFQRLRLGTVLGFLAGGAVVGPWGLGFIDEVEEIRRLAEFGVVFLLFVIGIELKPSRLWLMRRSVFGLGTAQVLVTGLLITWLALAFGLPERTAVVVGFGLALSSTAFGLQILAEKGDLRSAHGRSAFAILLLQDLAVVPLIALIPLLADGGLSLTEDVELVALETLLILLGVLLLGRFLLRPLLNVVAGTRTPEVFVATAVFVVLGAAWLTERAGFSMGLGAFLAGMLLSDSRYRHQILADIQPFRGILLGLFFMTVGMSIDFGLLGRQGPQVAGLVGGLLLVKAALLWTLCRATGRNHTESLNVALLLSQGGEFAFVLFGLAHGVGVMTEEMYQELVLVVVISMVLTPLLLKIAPSVEPVPATTLPRPAADEVPESRNHVIVAGFGRFGQCVVKILSKAGIAYRALDVNPAMVTEGRVRGFSVFYGDASRIDVLRAAGAANAALVVFAVNKIEAISQGASALHDAYPKLPIYARALDCRVGNRLRSMGVSQAFPESLEASLQLSREVLRASDIDQATADHLVEGIRRLECDRLTKAIPSAKQPQFKNILLVLSEETDATPMLERAFALAQRNQARLTVVDVVRALPAEKERAVQSLSPGGFQDTTPEQRRRRLDELITPMRERIEVDATVLMGTPHLEIIHEVLRGEHDLVVKTAQVGGGIGDRLFHNTDMQLLRKCPCSVWFFRDEKVHPYHRILAAVDIDYKGATHRQTKYVLNRQVLELAVSLALFELAELHVVHVWQAYGEDILRSGRSPFPQKDTDVYVEDEKKRHLDRLHELLAEVRGSVGGEIMDGVKTHVHLVKGDPRVEITPLAQNQDMDLLLIGTAARTGIQRFILGNTAEAIFNRLGCSVLVVKLPDFATSITDRN